MNGEIVPETEAKLSVYDSALMFGDMVFEMTRSFNKKQFELKAHIDRLYAGCKIHELNLSSSAQKWVNLLMAASLCGVVVLSIGSI